MTTALLLPTGMTAQLEELNLHELRQYYCYQMDMITQADEMLANLALRDHLLGLPRPQPFNTVIERQSMPACAFQTKPEQGNLLPSYYDTSEWQGAIQVNGQTTYPAVDKMTKKQILTQVKYQQGLLERFQAGTQTLANFASNVASATQPPSPMES